MAAVSAAAADGITDDGQDIATATAAAASDGNARRAAEVVDVDPDPRLLMAARCGDLELLKNLLLLNKDAVDVEAGSASNLPRVTMEGDTLLHVVAGLHPTPPCCLYDDGNNFLRCVGVDVIVGDIIEKAGAANANIAKRQAVEARNRKGNTPLHCAAAAGNADMITYLVDLMAKTADDDGEDAAELKKGFVKMQNECGETALHDAVRAPLTACIDVLIDVDPGLASIPHENGASPLYLAISLGEIEIAKHLYNKSDGQLSYSGPDGRNALHAAVPRGQVLDTVLGWLREDGKRRKDRVSSSGSQATTTGSSVPTTTGTSVPVTAAAAADDCLLKQLTVQRDKKQKGSTPLHLAASLEGWSDARPVSIMSASATKWLLDANKSTAYQADDQGWYPIHVAAYAGTLRVVKLLLERCPDCATLRDGQGRTFLHVAADKSRYHVVEYVVRGARGKGMPHDLSRMMNLILNAQDSNGDTALHAAVGAADKNHIGVFNCMFRNRQVRLDVANKKGMTPLDVSFTKIPAGFNYNLNPRNIVRSSLLDAGAPHGADRPDLFLAAEHMPKRRPDKESTKHTAATQVMGVVTALVATVTFASAFTLPGGYRSADGGGAAAGTPVLAGSFAFDAFVLADTLAFICSIAATCTLVYAGVPALDISLRNWYFSVSAVLLQSAVRSLVSAFALGLYLALAPVDRTMAVAVCVIIFASSLYGNMGPWRIFRMATTVLARIGIRPYKVVSYAKGIFFELMIHFGSYVVIFGLPAIRRWLIPAIRRWAHHHQ